MHIEGLLPADMCVATLFCLQHVQMVKNIQFQNKIDWQ